MPDTPAGARDWVAPFGGSAAKVLGGLLDMAPDTVEGLFARNILFRAED